jgi:hypothetical protein
MNQNEIEIWEFANKDDELKYAQMIERGQYSEIPKYWLGIFLDRTRINLKLCEKFLEENGIQRPAITTPLTQKIKEIEVELSRQR